MIDRKEVELLIRAQLQGTKDLAGVTKSIEELEKAIDKQSAAAKRGEASLDDLKSTLLSLQQAQDSLKNIANQIGQFQRLGDAIQKTSERADKARASYEKYRASLEGVADVSDKQQDKLVRLSAAADRAAATLAKQQGQHEQYATSLREAGVSIDDLAGAENRVRESAAQLGIAISKTSKSISTFATDARAAREAAAAFADEQRRVAETEAATAAAMEAQQRQVADAAERYRQGERRNYEKLWEDLLAEREAAKEREIAAEREVAAAKQKYREAERRQYENDLTRLFDERDAALARQAEDSGFRQMADDAERSAKGFTTLARAATDLRPKLTSVRDTVNAILNPSAQARKTLAGVEAEIQQVAKAAAETRPALIDFKEQFRSLAESQRALAAQAGLLDYFRQQTAALRASRQEFVQARAKVAEYAAIVRQGGQAAKDNATALRQAQDALRGSSASLQAQLNTTRQARQALREAGIATNDLVTAQNRLTAAARTGAAAAEQLRVSQERLGNAVDGTNRKFRLFGGEGRTTLSYLQRIRGEVLALATAYVGLQGAIGLATSSAQAQSTRAGLEAQLSLSAGDDPRAVAEELAYIRGQADRVGLSFEDAAKGYAKFAAASRLAGQTQQQTRFIWETFAEVGRVANLSTEDLNGVYKALEQIVSKGKIQAEELRGQLGDRLFGAFQVAAQALKDTYPDLDKALKDGVVTSDQLIAIAAKYREIVADQLPAATQTLTANQARLNSAINDFQLMLANAGWYDTYNALIKDLTTFLRSEDGKKFAQNLSSAFSTVADALRGLFQLVVRLADEPPVAVQALVEMFQLLGEVLGFAGDKAETAASLVSLFVDAWVAYKALGLVSELEKVTAKLVEQGVVSEASATKVGKLRGAFMVLFAAISGWEIGNFLRKFDTIRAVGAAVVGTLMYAWKEFTSEFEIMWTRATYSVRGLFATLLNSVTFGMRKVTQQFGQLAAAAGMEDLAKKFAAFQISLEFETNDKELEAKISEMRKRATSELKAFSQIVRDQIKFEWEGGAAALEAAQQKTEDAAAQPTPAPDFTPKPNPNADKDAEEKLKKRQALIKEIESALNAMSVKADKADKDSLAAQLRAIDTQYAPLREKIASLGGKTGSEFMARFDEALGKIKFEAVNKFNQALIDQQNALNNKLEDAEAAAGRRRVNELQVRLDAVKKRYEDTYRDIAKLRELLEVNGRATTQVDDSKARLDAAVVQLQNAEQLKFYEEQINTLLQTRQNKLQDINNQMAAGVLNARDAQVQTNDVLNETQGKMDTLVGLAREFALAMQAAGKMDPTVLDAFIAKLNVASAKSKEMQVFIGVTRKDLENIGSDAIVGGIDAAAENIGKAAAGAQSWGDALRNTGQAFLQFAADFLRQIGLMIIKQIILNSLQSMSFGGGAGVPVGHVGGVVGHTSFGSGRNRTVSPAWFSNAPRYHTGGMVGLAPDEYPAILRRNEEVLTQDDPRNILNGGGAQGSAAPTSPQNIKIINQIDSGSVVSEGLASSEGTKAIFNFMRANRKNIKLLLNGA